MKFLRLFEPLLTVLFENEDIIAFDKPYGFNAHTNDSKIDHSEFIEDGLIEMLEKQRGHRLHIIHRLDQTTTGVIIFGKSQASAKIYAEFFFDRKVKKTYWFVTAKKTSISEQLVENSIIHKGKELEAKTEFRNKKRSRSFELWEAKPFTGRNHQIRIHAKAAGISILGDPKYDGKEFQFLCLHNKCIEFPNGIVIESEPPVYFEQLELLEDLFLSKAFFEIDRRLRLFSTKVSTEECFRWIHLPGGTTENGLTLDQYGNQLVANLQKLYLQKNQLQNESLNEVDSKRLAAIAAYLRKPLSVRLGKTFQSLNEAWIAREQTVRYEVSADGGPSLGLPLNQRLQRRWVLLNSEGKTVLNLFAQSGTYTVCSALGGAKEVTSIETSKSNLAWIKRNLELNEVQPLAVKILCRDSMVFLKQAMAKRQTFDLITCDAPSFLRGEKGVFKVETDLESLLKACLQCLAPKGILLFATTSEALFLGDIIAVIKKVQRELDVALEIESIQASFDFELPNEKTLLKSFLIHRK